LVGTTDAPDWGYPASPAWSPDGRWIAFSFIEYKKSTTFYLINPEDDVLKEVDIFDSDQVYGSFEWELSATGDEISLYFLGDDDSLMRIYTVNDQGEVISTAIP
jgi:Tol biopolymer transport system component